MRWSTRLPTLHMLVFQLRQHRLSLATAMHDRPRANRFVPGQPHVALAFSSGRPGALHRALARADVKVN